MGSLEPTIFKNRDFIFILKVAETSNRNMEVVLQVTGLGSIIQCVCADVLRLPPKILFFLR